MGTTLYLALGVLTDVYDFSVKYRSASFEVDTYVFGIEIQHPWGGSRIELIKIGESFYDENPADSSDWYRITVVGWATGGKVEVYVERSETCTNYFFAEDQDGNALSENIRASIYKYTADGWTLVGDAWIAPRSGDHLTLTEDNSYKAVPITDISGYTTPKEQVWTACSGDITFVYERICPDPTVSITEVSNRNPESGEVVNFTGYASGGTGQSIVSRKWDFGDGTSSTLSNPSKSWKNTTGSPIIYTVRFTATNDCGKSRSTSTTVTVASEVVKTGIEIQFPSSLNGKQLIAHGAISTVLGMWWTGPAVHGGLWTKGRCTWDNIDSSKKYVIQTGDACETSLPRELPDVCAGTFANGDDVVILVRNPGFDFRVYGSGNVHTLSGTSFNVLYLDETSGDIITTAFTGKVCGWLGIPSGTECDAFWAEFYDPIFVANYMNIQATGEDMFGNARTLSWLDHVAFVASLVGSLPVFNLFPFAGVVKRLGDAGAVIIKKARDLPSTDLAIAMDAFWDICEYSPDAVRNMAQKIIDDFNNLMVENDDAFFTFHDKFTDYANRLYHDHYPVDVAKDAVESFRTLFEAAPEYIKRMWFQSVPPGVHNPAEDIYNTFMKFLGKTEADAMWGKIFKYLPDFVENWIFKIDEFIDGYQDITKTDIKDFLDEVKRGPEAPLAILESIEDVPAAGITTFSDFMAKLLDDGGSRVILHDFFGKYADEFVAIKNAQGEAAAHAWAINLADESLRTLNTDIIIRNFYDGTTALVKTDIDEVVDLTPEQFQLLLKSWESSGDLPALITKLDDGTEKQVLGNVFTLVDGYYDVVSGAVGKTQADEWVGKNLDISSEAMKAADPAKMADIPKSGQDYAHKAHVIADDVGLDADIVFDGRTLADDIGEVTHTFADEPVSNWYTKARQRANIIPKRLKKKWKKLKRYEKVLVIWFMVDNVAFMVYMLAKFLGLGPGDRGFDAWSLAKSVTDASWLCKASCEDGRYDDLSSDILILEDAITNLEDHLDKYSYSLKLENNYDAPYSVLEIGKSTLALMRECLTNKTIDVDPRGVGSIEFTSNKTCTAYIDGKRVGTVWPAGLFIESVNPGTYDLRMWMSGFAECKKTVTIEAGDSEVFHCDLQPPTCVLPVPKITAPGKAKVKEGVRFTGSATTESAITYWHWDFDDGTDSHVQSPSHLFWSTGTYTVKLTVTDDCGTAETTHTIVIEEEAPTPPTPPIIPPEEEAATIDVKTPIDARTGGAIVFPTKPYIFVDGKSIDKTAPYPIPFGGFGELPVKDPTTVTVKAAGYQDKSETFHLTDKYFESWVPYMDPVGYVPPVGHPIDFYIPENASLTVTPITTISRLVTGMRRIGR